MVYPSFLIHSLNFSSILFIKLSIYESNKLNLSKCSFIYICLFYMSCVCVNVCVYLNIMCIQSLLKKPGFDIQIMADYKPISNLNLLMPTKINNNKIV